MYCCGFLFKSIQFARNVLFNMKSIVYVYTLCFYGMNAVWVYNVHYIVISFSVHASRITIITKFIAVLLYCLWCTIIGNDNSNATTKSDLYLLRSFIDCASFIRWILARSWKMLIADFLRLYSQSILLVCNKHFHTHIHACMNAYVHMYIVQHQS